MFVDRVRIWAKAGKGGNGCCSFRREKFVPEGGPDGGDGGKGGDVVLKVNPHLNNLAHLQYKPHQFAQNGMGGAGALRAGRQGAPVVVEVPAGTVVSEIPTDETTFDRSVPFELARQVADMTAEGQTFLLCRGGRGGRGNAHFKSSVNRAPSKFEKGHEGAKGQFLLELKSIADVGLVGLPNAGKSSLLGALSAARPKIAPYPFTTLQPMVGVVELDGAEGAGNRFNVADIPGLIEGAHAGVGLGFDFLRHIERCRILAYVIDMAGTEGRDPREDYAQLRKEIKLYSADLAKRPRLVIANKTELPEASAHLAAFKKRFREKVAAVSAKEGEGLAELKRQLWGKLHEP
jgi:GTP-binding protein